MLIEVKVKVARIIGGKTRKRTETYILNKEFFSEAEYKVTEALNEEQQSNLIENFEIQSLRIAPIKEVCSQFQGDSAFVATLKDIFLADDGTEKTMRYKLLLWAESSQEALSNTLSLSRQGYEMQVEGIKEVDYIYLDIHNE